MGMFTEHGTWFDQSSNACKQVQATSASHCAVFLRAQGVVWQSPRCISMSPALGLLCNTACLNLPCSSDLLVDILTVRFCHVCCSCWSVHLLSFSWKISLVQIEPEWLYELAPHFYDYGTVGPVHGLFLESVCLSGCCLHSASATGERTGRGQEVKTAVNTDAGYMPIHQLPLCV